MSPSWHLLTSCSVSPPSVLLLPPPLPLPLLTCLNSCPPRRLPFPRYHFSLPLPFDLLPPVSPPLLVFTPSSSSFTNITLVSLFLYYLSISPSFFALSYHLHTIFYPFLSHSPSSVSSTFLSNPPLPFSSYSIFIFPSLFHPPPRFYTAFHTPL